MTTTCLVYFMPGDLLDQYGPSGVVQGHQTVCMEHRCEHDQSQIYRLYVVSTVISVMIYLLCIQFLKWNVFSCVCGVRTQSHCTALSRPCKVFGRCCALLMHLPSKAGDPH